MLAQKALHTLSVCLRRLVAWQALEQNTFRQVSMILTARQYVTFLAAGSVPEALAYNGTGTAHYCFGPFLGLRAGMVETALERDKRGDFTGVVQLKLTYTYGHAPGTVVSGTLQNECPYLNLVSLSTKDHGHTHGPYNHAHEPLPDLSHPFPSV